MNDYNSSSILVFNFFIFLFIAIIVITLAYFVTKFIALKYKNNSYKRNITIIERFSLGIDKSLVLIHLGDYYYFLFISKNNIELIDKVKDLNIKEAVDTTKSFEDILSKIRKK